MHLVSSIYQDSHLLKVFLDSILFKRHAMKFKSLISKSHASLGTLTALLSRRRFKLIFKCCSELSAHLHFSKYPHYTLHSISPFSHKELGSSLFDMLLERYKLPLVWNYIFFNWTQFLLIAVFPFSFGSVQYDGNLTSNLFLKIPKHL